MDLEYVDLIPKEKIILITKVVGNFHERLNNSVNYVCALIPTVTWMTISHIIPAEVCTYPYVHKSDMDSDVKLHHYK